MPQDPHPLQRGHRLGPPGKPPSIFRSGLTLKLLGCLSACENVLLVRCQISRPGASRTGQFCQHCHYSRAKILVLDLGRGRVRYRSQRQRDGCHLASTATGQP
jgi:hypothetical protein